MGQAKPRITGYQLFLTAYVSANATGLLSQPTMMANAAGEDLWIPPLLGCLGGLLLSWAVYKLHALYPGRSLVQAAELALGKAAGKLASAFYLLFMLYTTSLVLRQFSDFISQNFLVQTPTVVVASSLLAVCAIASKSGVEVICRIPVVFIPVLFGLLALIFVPTFSAPNHYPISWPHNPGGWLLGAYVMQVWNAVFVFSTFYLPFVAKDSKPFLWTMLTPVAFAVTMSALNWVVLLAMGQATAMYNYPFMTISRNVSFFEFFENLESIVMMVWVVCIFVRFAFTLYALAVGLAQLFQLPSEKPLIFPAALLHILFGFWGIKNVQFASKLNLADPTITVLAGMLLPLLIWAAAHVRKAAGSKSRKPNPTA